MNKEQLNQHFVEWFYNENWVDKYNRNGWMRDHFDNRDAQARHYWMLEAFMAGFELQAKLEQEDLDQWFRELEQDFEDDTDTSTAVQQFATNSAWPFPELK